MPGPGMAYALVGFIASVPAVVSAAVLLVLAARTAREQRAHPAWGLVAGVAALLGVAAAFAVILAPGHDDTGALLAWIVALDIVGVVAAAVAAVSRLAAGSRGPATRCIGPMAGIGLFTGTLLGFFVMPGIEPIGAALAHVQCANDPWCQTAEEAAAAAEVDGTATLWINGGAAADGVVAGARCEYDAPEDGFWVAATFEDADPPVNVELAVMEDGSYRNLALAVGDHQALEVKGWEPDGSLRVANGTTPTSGRIGFTDLPLLGLDGDIDPGSTVSGEVAWECPGFVADR